MTVEVSGLAQLRRALSALGVDISELKDVMGEIAAQGASLAADYAPRRSGRLAASIRGSRAAGYARVSAGGARVPYAGPINYGWPARNIRPALFLQQADAALRPRVVPQLETAINRLISARGLA